MPAKSDYWKGTNGLYPYHPATTKMSKNRFKQIWTLIYLVKPDKDDHNNDDENNYADNDDEEASVASNNSVTSDNLEDTRWYKKAAPIIDLVNSVSKKVCKWPAFTVSIDEQMKKFKGRLTETFQIKSKPISEGFKFWALCCSLTAFCYHFLPAARTHNEEGKGLIESTLNLLNTLPFRKEKNKRYVCAMDNLFTYSRVIEGARKKNIAIVGTA